MLKQPILLAMVVCLIGSPGFAQGMFEMGGVKSLSVGAGAGTAAAVAGHRSRPSQSVASAAQRSRGSAASNRQEPKLGLITDDSERNRINGEQFQKAGNTIDAEKCYRAALVSLSKTKGVGSEAALKVIESLSIVCYSQKKYAESASFYSAILADRTKQFGEDDSRTISAKHHMADILTEKGDHAGAVKHLDEAMASAKRLPAPLEPSKMIEMLDSYAIAMRGLGREQEADQLERQATELYAAREKGQ